MSVRVRIFSTSKEISNIHEMIFGGAEHCGQRHAFIERHEPSAVPDRQCKQINIGDLAMANESAVIEDFLIRNGDILGPERVAFVIERNPEQIDRSRCSTRAGITRLRDNPHESVLRDGT